MQTNHASHKLLFKVRAYILEHKDLYSKLYVDSVIAFTSTIIKNNTSGNMYTLYFKVPFIHPIVEDVNIQSLLSNRISKLLLPMAALAWEPSICYSYSNTIGQSLLNYNKVLKNMETNDVLHTHKCDCDNNVKLKPFIYKPYGHIYTGNLDIVENLPLR